MNQRHISKRVRLLAALTMPVALTFMVMTSFANPATAAARAHSSTTTMNIADVPYSGLAPIGLGISKGIFSHYGFYAVNLNDAGNVDNAIADIQGGSDQLAYVSTSLLVGAVRAGVPIRCVAPVGPVAEPIKGYPQSAIVVKKGSSITSLADLDGKTLALPTATGSNEETAKYAVTKGGGNWSSIHLVTSFNYTEMLTAVSNNEVSAAFELSPYIEAGTGAGQITILDDTSSINAGLTGDCFAATNSYISANKGTLRRFVDAMDEAVLFTAAHPRDVTTKLIATVSNEPVNAVVKSPSYSYTDSLSPNTLAQYQDFMVAVGALTRPIIRPGSLVWIAPTTPLTKLLFNGSGKFENKS